MLKYLLIFISFLCFNFANARTIETIPEVQASVAVLNCNDTISGTYVVNFKTKFDTTPIVLVNGEQLDEDMGDIGQSNALAEKTSSTNFTIYDQYLQQDCQGHNLNAAGNVYWIATEPTQ